MATFGKKLRHLRRKQNKSQGQVVAELMSMYPDMRISQTTLSAMEQRQGAPREDVLLVLCRYYGVKPDYFYNRQDDNHNARTQVANYIDALRLYVPGTPEFYAYQPSHDREVDHEPDLDMDF